MTRHLLLALALAVGLGATAPAFATGGLDGYWLTQDKRGIVQVAPCGGKECGKIVWIKDPLDAAGKPRHDKNNPDAALVNRPIIGLPTLSAIAPNADGAWDAVSYDPRNGETHDITVTLLSGGTKIELKGCVLVICESEVWTKSPPPPQAAPADPTQTQTSN